MLKNRVFCFLALFVVGYIGFYLGSYYNQKNQKNHQVINPPVYKPSLAKKFKNTPSTVVKSRKLTHKTEKTLDETSIYLPKNLSNQKVLNMIIDNTEHYQIEAYLDKLIAKDDADFMQISDKRTFAKSLLREFLGEKNNLHLDTNARLSFSKSNKPNNQNITSFEFSKSRASIYAHLQFDSLMNPINNVFVKWTHNGKVLFFNKKKIDASIEDNWVNWTPDENWEIGRYEVTFYQFDKFLTPITTADYYVD